MISLDSILMFQICIFFLENSCLKVVFFCGFKKYIFVHVCRKQLQSPLQRPLSNSGPLSQIPSHQGSTYLSIKLELEGAGYPHRGSASKPCTEQTSLPRQAQQLILTKNITASFHRQSDGRLSLVTRKVIARELRAFICTSWPTGCHMECGSLAQR